MTCPNCGRSIEGDLTYCPVCLNPLSNAHYTLAPSKPKKKGKVLMIVLFLFVFFGIAATGGYYYYLETIKTQCSDVTRQLMDCAKSMDFSRFPEENLPEGITREADLRQTISDRFDQSIDTLGLSYYIYLLGIEMDDSTIFSNILKDADYQIDSVEADYKTCTVNLSTSNYNYPAIMENMQKELSDIAEEANKKENWWMSLKDWISSILTDSQKEDALPETFSAWLTRMREDQTKHTVSGKITFGLKDRHWILQSIDDDLLYNYYGFPSDTVNTNETTD